MKEYHLHVHDGNRFSIYEFFNLPPKSEELRALIQQAVIDESWHNFANWWYLQGNTDNCINSLYRVVNNASEDVIETIRRSGNDRTHFQERELGWDIYAAKITRIDPKDFIWAADFTHIYKAIERIKISNQPCVLLIYDKNKFIQAREDIFIYRLKREVVSFLEALRAMVVIYLA